MAFVYRGKQCVSITVKTALRKLELEFTLKLNSHSPAAFVRFTLKRSLRRWYLRVISGDA